MRIFISRAAAGVLSALAIPAIFLYVTNFHSESDFGFWYFFNSIIAIAAFYGAFIFGWYAVFGRMGLAGLRSNN